MGYFSALARQSGIRVGGQELLPRAGVRSAVSPIEVEETRVAPEPVRPARTGQPPRPAAPPSGAQARSVPPVRPPDEPPRAPRRAPAVNRDTPAPPPPVRVIVPGEAPAPVIREVVVEVEKELGRTVEPRPDGLDETEETIPATPAAGPEPPSVVIRPRAPEPPPERRKLPTLAEVRAWVARPPLQESGTEPPELVPERPSVPAPRAAPPPPARLEPIENFTLDIGAIAITFDAPAPTSQAPAPVRPAPPASKPSSSGRASRHYLRI
ncbi:MAG: hypothetical protein DMG07_07740 [Acidobacteria bacterium]|nr:MAG: hypothetical protein DMG07_07740 [Acidobacteriota bacterium]